ncbi:hypothetical protein LINGRAHAP2_LOCUS35496 [Linum grandiflorum]
MDLGESMIESNLEVKSLVGSEDQDGTKKVCFDCKTSSSRHGVRNLIRKTNQNKKNSYVAAT